MYIWNIFKTLIYLLFCSKKFTYSEPNDNLINKLKPISLNLKDKKSNETYNYIKKYDSEIYTANNGFGFSSVNTLNSCCKSDKIIWDAENNANYAHKVVLKNYNYKNMNEVKIYLFNKEERFFVKKYKDLWKQIYMSHIYPQNLNIQSPNETYFYTFEGNNNYGIYEAKSPFIFSSLSKFCGPSTKMIWKATKYDEFTTKIILDGVQTRKKNSKIMFFYINGEVKNYTLLCGRWIQSNPLKIINLAFNESTFEYKYYKNNKNVEFFIPNGNILFKGIKKTEFYGLRNIDVDIWYSRNKQNCAKIVIIAKYSKTETYIILILVNNEFIIFFKKPRKKIWIDHTNKKSIIKNIESLEIKLNELKKGKEIENKCIEEKKVYWKQTYENWLKSLPFLHVQHETPVEPTIPDDKPVKKSINLIVLDLSKMYDLVGYEIKYKPDKIIYIADDSYLFLQVQNGDELVWKSSDGSYPYRVIYKVVENKPKLKVYFNDNK